MSGFLDHLFDSKASGKKGRERIRYREKLRSLITDAPSVRRLIPQDIPSLTFASLAAGKNLPGVDLVMDQIGEAASADSFREWKRNDEVRPIWRLDPISSEEQVLETRAMGADAYTIEVRKHDQAGLQFLVEVGRDYGLPAILSCRSPEDLALGLLVQDGGILWLRGEIHSDSLLDLETLRGRTVIFEAAEPLTVSPSWVVTLVQLFDSIPLPVEDPEDIAAEERRRVAKAQEDAEDLEDEYDHDSPLDQLSTSHSEED
jgi:hypothetical protein